MLLDLPVKWRWVGEVAGDARKKTRNQGGLGVFGLSTRVSGSPTDVGTFSSLLAWWYCFNFLPSSAQLFLAAEIYIYSRSLIGYICFEQGAEELIFHFGSGPYFSCNLPPCKSLFLLMEVTLGLRRDLSNLVFTSWHFSPCGEMLKMSPRWGVK